MKKYPAILRGGDTLEWLGEVPPESLTGKSYDVIIEIDTDQFKKTDLSDDDHTKTIDIDLGNKTFNK